MNTPTSMSRGPPRNPSVNKKTTVVSTTTSTNAVASTTSNATTPRTTNPASSYKGASNWVGAATANKSPIRLNHSLPSPSTSSSSSPSPPGGVKKGIPGCVGLANLGNSCYMNCIIQCLAHAEPLTNYILGNDQRTNTLKGQGSFAKDLNKTNPLGSGGKVAEAYASLLSKIWSGQHACIKPLHFKFTIATFANQFNNTHQHDAQELAAFLIDGVHEDLNRIHSQNRKDRVGVGDGNSTSNSINSIHAMDDKSLALKTWQQHLTRNDSIIVDHFQGMLQTTLTCPQCNKISKKFDIFSSLSLTLIGPTDGRPIPIESCLEHFTRQEQLDDHNAWHCTNCKQRVRAIKQVQLWSVPDILIIHLKRFTFQSLSRKGGICQMKIENEVDFPVDHLDLQSHIIGPTDPNAPPAYKLFGVVEHTGQTADSGHYKATVRNAKDHRFYKCNDSQIGGATDNFKGSEAYVLFYKRKKGLSRWAGLERIIQHGYHASNDQVDDDGFTMVVGKVKK